MDDEAFIDSSPTSGNTSAQADSEDCSFTIGSGASAYLDRRWEEEKKRKAVTIDSRVFSTQLITPALFLSRPHLNLRSAIILDRE